MKSSDWLFDAFKVKFSLDKDLNFKNSILNRVFDFDIRNIDVENKVKELKEVYFDEGGESIFKIQYLIEKK